MKMHCTVGFKNLLLIRTVAFHSKINLI